MAKDVASVKEEVDGRKERRGVQEMLGEGGKGRLRRCGGCEVLRFCGEVSWGGFFSFGVGGFGESMRWMSRGAKMMVVEVVSWR